LYDVYRVRGPSSIVLLPGGETSEIVIGDQEIRATGASTGGTARVARNWYPRWRAEVNGVEATVTRTADGYMAIAVPAGAVDLTLRYVVDGWDWLGRGLAVAGGAAMLGMIGFGRAQRRPQRAPLALARRLED